MISYFKTKDKRKFEPQRDIICQVKCSAENFRNDYIEESGNVQ